MDVKTLEAFEMWTAQQTKSTPWLDRTSNDKVPQKTGEDNAVETMAKSESESV